jgi:hypothetical protein
MFEVDRARCRQSARECIELAQMTQDPDKKAILMQHAQEWLRLAYADQSHRFQQAVDDFNSDNLVLPFRPQRQPMQQQQAKARDGK